MPALWYMKLTPGLL